MVLIVVSGDPGSATLDHFSHLRRQWAAKAQRFSANLHQVPKDENEDLYRAFQDLLQGYKTTRVTPSAIYTKRKRDTSYKVEVDDIEEQHQYYSDEDVPDKGEPKVVVSLPQTPEKVYV